MSDRANDARKASRTSTFDKKYLLHRCFGMLGCTARICGSQVNNRRTQPVLITLPNERPAPYIRQNGEPNEQEPGNRAVTKVIEVRQDYFARRYGLDISR